MVTLATQMAAILSLSQMKALFGQYRQTRIKAMAASSGVAIAPVGRTAVSRRWSWCFRLPVWIAIANDHGC